MARKITKGQDAIDRAAKVEAIVKKAVLEDESCSVDNYKDIIEIIDSSLDELKSLTRFFCNALVHDFYVTTSMEDVINVGLLIHEKIEEISFICKEASDLITKNEIENQKKL